MTFGETPIDLAEPQMTASEAVEITGISAKSLSNWHARGVISIGTMHRTGRRLYSILDLAELSLAYELTAMVAMPAAQAAAAASWARTRGFQMSERDEAGKLKHKGTKISDRHFLLIYVHGDDHKIRHEVGTDWLTRYSMQHPYVVVPLDEIMERILNRAIDVLEREHNAGGGGDEA